MMVGLTGRSRLDYRADEIFVDYVWGMRSLRQVAARYGTSKSSVHRLMKRMRHFPAAKSLPEVKSVRTRRLLRCKVCKHRSREAIDTLLMMGRAVRWVARQFDGLSRSGLQRHLRHAGINWCQSGFQTGPPEKRASPRHFSLRAAAF